MLTVKPAFDALINGFTIRDGITRRNLIPISVKILILTPAANAEIHNVIGTNVKKIAKTMMIPIIAAPKPIASIPILLFLLLFFKFANNYARTLYLDYLNIFPIVDKPALRNGVNALVIQLDCA